MRSLERCDAAREFIGRLETAKNRDKLHGLVKLHIRYGCGRKIMMRILRGGMLVGGLLLWGASAAVSQDAGKHAITFEDMMQMHRIGDPQISPDGQWVAY